MMKKLLVVGCALTWAQTLYSQTVEEVLKQFPGQHAAMIRHAREMTIFLKDNQPVAESKDRKEILVLDDKAHGVYNKYRVYHGSFDVVKDIEAFTKVPDGNRFRTVKVTEMKTQQSRSTGVFYDDSKETVFDFPAMTNRAIATVSHSEFHKDAHLLVPFYVSSYMPVVNASFSVTFPQNMVVKYMLRNNKDNLVQVKETKRGRQVTYEFTATGLQPYNSFPNAPPISYYEPHVIIQIVSYTNNDGQQVSFLGSVDDLHKWNAGFLKDINTKPSAMLQNLADSLTKGVTTEKEKARNIYKWVQDNIKYVAFEAGLEGFIPRQAADVCTRRYGDCKDMSSLITQLLKLAGLKGYFTWIGTRDIPYDYTEVPLPIVDNHMIATVHIGDEWIFLDGTDPNCIFGVPPKAIQGKQALVSLGPDSYNLLRVPELTLHDNSVVDTTRLVITESGIKGVTSVYYNGYYGADAMNSMLYCNSKDLKEYVKSRLQKGSNKYMMGEYQVKNVDRNRKVVNINATFDVPDYSKRIGDELYINLHLDRSYNSALLDTTKRKIPVDNDFRFHVKNYTELEVPEGYEISPLPKDHEYRNELYGFSISYKQQQGKVVSSFEFRSDVMMLQPEHFSKWNDVMKELAVQTKKQLIIKKK